MQYLQLDGYTHFSKPVHKNKMKIWDQIKVIHNIYKPICMQYVIKHIFNKKN